MDKEDNEITTIHYQIPTPVYCVQEFFLLFHTRYFVLPNNFITSTYACLNIHDIPFWHGFPLIVTMAGTIYQPLYNPIVHYINILLWNPGNSN